MLGIDLALELHKEYTLYGLDVVHSPLSKVHRFRRCDITDTAQVRRAAAAARPAVVIHTAAWTDVDGCELDKKKAYRINSEGTKNVARACKVEGATAIYISTDFVFDGKKHRPYRESDRTGPLGVYGDSKLRGERALQRMMKEYYILRTSWLFGPYGKNFVDTVIEKAGTERVLKVVRDQVGSPTYTKDLAKAIRVLVEKIFAGHEMYGVYHVSNSGTVSWYSYAREIVRLAGVDNGKVVPITSRELARPAQRPRMSVLDNSKFTNTIKFRMRHWRKALEDFIALRLKG